MTTKRSINKKEISEITGRELAAGKSRESILEELAEQYYDKKTLANYVGSVPTPELRERYRTANTVLFVLILTAALLKTGVVVALVVLNGKSPFLLLLAPVLPIINIWLAVEVKNTRGYSYWMVIMLAALGITDSFRVTVSYEPVMIAEIVLLAAIGGLGVYIARKMFPHLRFGRLQIAGR